MNAKLLLSWLVAWTVSGSAILLLTHWLNERGRSAEVRHLAWVGAFLCLFLLPVSQVAYRLIQENMVSVEPAICAPVIASLLATGLLGLWGAGAGWICVRAVLARAAVKQWQGGGLPHRSEIYEDEFRSIEVRIAQGSDPLVPITWGVLRPVVLLPRAARDWDAARMAAVLGHELGHVRRLDNLTQRLALVVCAIHWFNPLFWFAARRMEAEAEVAADDFAILRGMKASSYAAELLGIAAQLRSSGWRCPLTQTAMVKPFTLEKRLQCIIDPLSRRRSAPVLARAGIAGTFAGVAIALLVLTPRLATLIGPNPAPAHCPVSESSASANNGL